MVFSFCSSVKSQAFAGAFASEFAFFDDGNAIHQNVFHARRILMWLGKGGAILDCVWIEDDEVGPEAILNFAASGDAKGSRRKRGHATNGFFETKDAEFVDVMMQRARV